MQWRLVTDSSPSIEDLPVTVIRSRERDRIVWTSLLPRSTEAQFSDEVKQSVSSFFEHGETVGAEDWWPRLS